MSDFVMGAEMRLTDNFSKVFSQISDSTKEFVQTISSANQAADSFHQEVNGFADTLGAADTALGNTQTQAREAASGINEIRNAIQQFNSGFQTLSGLPRILRQVATTKMDALKSSFAATRLQAGLLVGALKAFVNTKITTAISGFSKFAALVTEGKQGLSGVAAALKNVAKMSISNTYTSMQKLASSAKAFASVKLSGIVNKLKEFKNNATGGTNGANKLFEALKKAASVSFSALHSGLSRVGSLAATAGGKVAKGFGTIATGAVKGFGIATATLATGVIAASAGIFKLTTMASDLDETLNKTDVAFGDSATAVKAWSETSLKSMGLSKQTALDMTALYGDMGTSMGIPQQEAAAMSMEMTQLAADLASFKNIGIDKATTALNGVFTGETESLKTLGIVMTQTELDAFAMSNGFGKTTKQMTEAEKVSLRYAFVMSRTANAQGDFARTGGGFANQLRVFQQTIKEIGTSMGGIFIPALTKSLQTLNAFGGEVNAVFADGWQDGDAQKLADIFNRMLDTGVDALSRGLPKIVETVVPIINTLVGAILKALPTVVPTLLNGATTIFTSLIQMIQQNKQPLISLAVSVITSLATFLLDAVPQLILVGADLLLGLVQGLTQQLPQILTTGMQSLTNFISGIVSRIPMLVQTALQLIQAVVSGLIANLPLIVQSGITLLMSLIQGIVSMLPSLVQMALQLIMSLVQGLIANLPLIINAAVQLVMSLVQGIVTMLPMVIQSAIQLIIALLQGIISNLPTIVQAAIQIVVALAVGLLQAIPQLVAAVPQIIFAILETIFSTNWLQVGWDIVKGIGKGLWDGVKGIFGGAGEAGGKEMANGAAQGAESGLAAITDASAQTASNFTTGLQPDYSAISGYGVEAGSSLSAGLTTGAAGIGTTATQVGTDAMLGLSSGFTTALPDTLATVSNVGLESVTGLSTGMTDNLGLATTAATTVTTGVTDTFKEISLYDCGTNAMQGFVDGISAMRGSVMAVANEIANSVKTTVNSALDIHSPSRVLEASGEFTGEGFVNGIAGTLKSIREASQSMGNSALAAFSGSGFSVPNTEPSGTVSHKATVINNHFAFNTDVALNDVGAKDPETLANQILSVMYSKLQNADSVLSQGEMAVLL